MGPKFVVLALLLSALLTSQSAGPTFAAKPAAHKSESIPSAPQPVTPLLGICDVSGALDVLGDLSDADANKKRVQISLLQGRILECSRKIAALTSAAAATSATPYWASSATAPAALPPPPDVCTHPAPATTASNRIALFEILEHCSTYVTTVTASATPAPAETPLPSIASRPTFYVFATGAVDPTTATVLIRSLVARLTKAERRAVQSRATRADPEALPAVLVASRADWTATESFTAQCQLDPNTRGALVIRTSMPETYRNNYLLLVANFTQLSATVDVLGCAADDHNVNAAPLSLYSEEAVTGKAHQDTVTLGIFSSIAAFLATDKSKTTVTTGNGSTTVVKSDSTAPAFSGNVLGYFEGSNLDLPAQNASVQMNVAAKRLTNDAMAGLHRLCGRPEVLTLAAQGDPAAVPPSPPEHRTLAFKAAYEYVGDCALFGSFATTP